MMVGMGEVEMRDVNGGGRKEKKEEEGEDGKGKMEGLEMGGIGGV